MLFIDSLHFVKLQASPIRSAALFQYKAFQAYLMERGIASSISNVFQPSRNGPAEKTAGTFWKAFNLP